MTWDIIAVLEIELMRNALPGKIEKIRILLLSDSNMLFTSVDDAIAAIEKYDIAHARAEQFCKFEIYIKFTNGDRIECSFQEREKAIEFLEIYKD